MKPTSKVFVILLVLLAGIYGCKEKTCDAYYTGNSCKDEIRAQYYASYNTVTSCSTAYTITVSSSEKGVQYVKVSNIDKMGSEVFAQFDESNQTTLVIPQQVSNGTTIQGSISFTSGFNTANITYNKTIGGSSLPACTGTISK